MGGRVLALASEYLFFCAVVILGRDLCVPTFARDSSTAGLAFGSHISNKSMPQAQLVCWLW